MPPISISIMPIAIVPVSIGGGTLLVRNADCFKLGHSVLHVPVPRQRVERENIPVEVVFKIENPREAGSRDKPPLTRRRFPAVDPKGSQQTALRQVR